MIYETFYLLCPPLPLPLNRTTLKPLALETGQSKTLTRHVVGLVRYNFGARGGRGILLPVSDWSSGTARLGIK